MARKALSKKIRFEVFKRDLFTCKYCGKSPGSGAILNVDHVIPVAGGGSNDFENLITSCFDCNSGKSDRSLNTLSSVSPYMEKSLSNLSDYKEQVTAFFKFINEKNKTSEKTVDLILSQMGDPDADFDKKHRASVKMFMRNLSVDNLMNYSNIAESRFSNRTPYSKFKYFCGICHNVIKENGVVSNG